MKDFFEYILALVEWIIGQVTHPAASIYEYYSFLPNRDQIYLSIGILGIIIVTLGVVVLIAIWIQESDSALASIAETCLGILISGGVGCVIIIVICGCLFTLSIKWNLQNTAQVQGIIENSFIMIILLKTSGAIAAYNLGQWFITKPLAGLIATIISICIAIVIYLTDIFLPVFAILLLLASCVTFYMHITHYLGETLSINEFAIAVICLGYTVLVLIAGIVEPEAVLSFKVHEYDGADIILFMLKYYFPFALFFGMVSQLLKKLLEKRETPIPYY